MRKGYRHTEEAKRKIGLALKGRRNPNAFFKKGQKFTEEHKRKLSLAKIGIKLSKEHRKNMSISAKKSINSGRFKKGHKLTEEAKRKLSEIVKGRKHSKEAKEKLSKTRKGLIKEGKLKIISGKEHYNWQGGISFEPYGLKFNNQLREQIRMRDNYRCQECFRHQDELRTKTNKKYRLPIHHIDFNKQNNKSNNLISLCRGCHTQTNFNREEWTEYYQDRINTKGVINE